MRAADFSEFEGISFDQSHQDCEAWNTWEKEHFVALKMLGRQSEAEHSLSFEERNAIIFRLKQFLTAFLIEKNISFIVFRSIPHFAAEYILQEVARKLGVLCVSRDIDPISKSFLVDLHNRKFTGKLYSPSPCDETATIEVRRLFDLFLENHTNKKLLHPNYFIKNANSAQTARKPFTLVVRILKTYFWFLLD